MRRCRRSALPGLAATEERARRERAVAGGRSARGGRADDGRSARRWAASWCGGALLKKRTLAERVDAAHDGHAPHAADDGGGDPHRGRRGRRGGPRGDDEGRQQFWVHRGVVESQNSQMSPPARPCRRRPPPRRRHDAPRRAAAAAVAAHAARLVRLRRRVRPRRLGPAELAASWARRRSRRAAAARGAQRDARAAEAGASSGFELLEEERRATRVVTFIERLDALLGGGVAAAAHRVLGRARDRQDAARDAARGERADPARDGRRRARRCTSTPRARSSPSAATRSPPRCSRTCSGRRSATRTRCTARAPEARRREGAARADPRLASTTPTSSCVRPPADACAPAAGGEAGRPRLGRLPPRAGG